MNLDDLLAKLVLGAQPLDKFEVSYAEDVGDPADEVVVKQFTTALPKKGLCHLYVLRGGLTVVVDGRERWSLYESLERVEEREYFRRWGEYIRSGWTSKVPTVAGTYATRTRDGFRARDREFKLVNGKLRDCTPSGGYCAPNKVTEWQGEFWSLPMPPLKGAL